MSLQCQRKLSKAIRPLLASAFAIYSSAATALAKDPLEAAQELSGSSDPNGFTLMIVSICMLFVFALTLIIATSMHVFKKKPRPVQSSRVNSAETAETESESEKELSYTS
ncbi:MAG: hypothetical protein K2X27_03845 [Candidatus Obscuribacterales bacterium]|nr:hypothetical protein [Candidatus Obscuribacterales bacterium]